MDYETYPWWGEEKTMPFVDRRSEAEKANDRWWDFPVWALCFFTFPVSYPICWYIGWRREVCEERASRPSLPIAKVIRR